MESYAVSHLHQSCPQGKLGTLGKANTREDALIRSRSGDIDRELKGGSPGANTEPVSLSFCLRSETRRREKSSEISTKMGGVRSELNVVKLILLDERQ